MTESSNANAVGLMAYCRLHERYVRVIATDGDKYLAFVMDAEVHREKACNFYKKPFGKQCGKEHRYARRLLLGRKKGVSKLKDFWKEGAFE